MFVFVIFVSKRGAERRHYAQRFGDCDWLVTSRATIARVETSHL